MAREGALRHKATPYVCTNGHRWTAATTAYDKQGYRYCRTCKQNRQRACKQGYRRDHTRCIVGHPYTPENTYVDPQGRRRCRICRADRARQRAKRDSAGSPISPLRPDTCRAGHPRTPENTYNHPGGWRVCRVCQRATQSELYSRYYIWPCAATGCTRRTTRKVCWKDGDQLYLCPLHRQRANVPTRLVEQRVSSAVARARQALAS